MRRNRFVTCFTHRQHTKLDEIPLLVIPHTPLQEALDTPEYIALRRIKKRIACIFPCYTTKTLSSISDFVASWLWECFRVGKIVENWQVFERTIDFFHK